MQSYFLNVLTIRLTINNKAKRFIAIKTIVRTFEFVTKNIFLLIINNLKEKAHFISEIKIIKNEF